MELSNKEIVSLEERNRYFIRIYHLLFDLQKYNNYYSLGFKKALDNEIKEIEEESNSISKRISSIKKKCDHTFVDVSDDRRNFDSFQCTKCGAYK